MTGDKGMGTEYSISFSTALIIIAFISVALYNVGELTVTIFRTFKRWNGLYFWSVLASSCGIVPYCIGFILKFFHPNLSAMVALSLISPSWVLMVTGQSLALYSRLHLVARGTASDRWVLGMIICNALLCHVLIIVFVYGSNLSNPGPFIRVYSVYEKIQITVFFLQEVIISGMYVYRTVRLLHSEGNIRPNGRNIMKHLIWVNIIVIALDITMLAIAYAGHYDIEVTYKPFIYSVKLKMEFDILNKLVTLFQGSTQKSSSNIHSSAHHPCSEYISIKKQGGMSKSVNDGGNRAMLGSVVHNAPEQKAGEVIKTTEIRVARADTDGDDIELDSLGNGSANDGTGQGRRKSFLWWSICGCGQPQLDKPSMLTIRLRHISVIDKSTI
ncbi:hypothetical protein BCR34DRAFT_310366 [Clohesyomyces aquaticus]|uniref:DUF7703 domain-containing protein n=1 Tax=Clohesyomyces aquaticus TaxID=1231657 RepID=A0A1Y1ZP15_9PLEO|nr:hypothetical protein BCR34DRAFT_310366 [Clohesyomyces aquaticus]